MPGNLPPPRDVVAELSGYDPGHYKVDINLSANENPYDLPADLRRKIIDMAQALAFNRYPDPQALELRAAIADRFGLEVGQVAVGNGGDELIQTLLMAYGGSSKTAVSFEPTFVMYGILAELTSTNFMRFNRRRDFGLPKNALDLVKSVHGSLVFACSPNNPSGNLIADEELLPLLTGNRGLVVVDEAYAEFSRVSVGGLLNQYPNLVIIRTFSKAFSLAGLRVGYMLASPEVISNIQKVKLPYNVNVFSQAAATVLLRHQARFDGAIEEIISERERVFEELEMVRGLTPCPSAANFILVKTGQPSAIVWRKLLAQGILVRNFNGVRGLRNCLRITIGSPEQNDRVIGAMTEIAEG